MGKEFKVIIVGASLTGLATALALESAGIDYVVLEGGMVAPPVGATIALMGPAFRILDQLGCYDDIVAATDKPTEIMRLYTPDGVPLQENEANMHHLTSRHGYPMIFMAREKFHQTLYNRVKNKDKVLTGKRVDNIITASNGVTVKTKDGETFSGDILIGADGVHSFVRREMWRLAAESRPGWFREDEAKSVKSDHMITFGVTTPRDAQPFIDFTTQKGHTHLSAMGSGGIVFWFLSTRTDKHDGASIPRYTDKDVLANVEKHGDEHVSNGWTLRELHDCSTITGAAPVVEGIYSKWHYKRILTIGDAAHSQHPISGYGGQSCIESVAALINALKPALDKDAATGGNGLTDDDFERLFAGIRETRMRRLNMLQRLTRGMTGVLRLDGTASFVLPFYVPLSGQQGQMMRFSKAWMGANRIHHLPIPDRPRAIPYLDELPANRIQSKLPKYLTITVLLASFYMSLTGTALPDSVTFDSWAGLHPTLNNYTGTGLDGLLGILSSFFSYVLVPRDPIPMVQSIELLSILSPVCAIWMIEANRKSNKFSLIRLPSLFTIAAQIVTFARAGHFYWILAILTSSNSIIEKHVPVAASRSVLPAVCLGYILPSILMFIPFSDDNVRDRFAAFWQPSPLWAGILSVVIASVLQVYEKFRLRQRLGGKMTSYRASIEKAMAWYTKREVPALKNTYAFLFAVSALIHVSIVLYAWLEGGVPTLWRLFGDVPLTGTAGLTDPFEAVFVMLKYDLIFSALPMLVFLLYTVWDLRSLGYISTSTATRAAAAVVAGQVLVSPAATYAGLWYFRESVFDGLSKDVPEPPAGFSN